MCFCFSRRELRLCTGQSINVTWLKGAIGTYPVGCWRYFWEAIQVSIVRYTPKFNKANEKSWLEDYFPSGKVTFRGYVKLRVGSTLVNQQIAMGPYPDPIHTGGWIGRGLLQTTTKTQVGETLCKHYIYGRIHQSAFSGSDTLRHDMYLHIQKNELCQKSYNTPLEHTPGNPLANYERNPFIACW